MADIKKELDREKAAVQRLMRSPDWFYFENMLRRLAYYDMEIFSDNPYTMAYRVGARSVYLRIKNIMKEE